MVGIPQSWDDWHVINPVDLTKLYATLAGGNRASDFGRGVLDGVSMANPLTGASIYANVFQNPYTRTALSAAGPLGRGLSNLSRSAPTGASPNQTGSIGQGLGSILGQVAQRVGALGKQPQGQQDPMMDLYNQLLEQLQSPVQMPTGVNTQDLMQQVQAALNPIYDQRRDAANATNKAGQAEIEKMYRALSDDFERLAPEQVKQADANKQQIEQMYGQLRSNVEGSYSRVAKEQGDLFKQLGIESAAPEVLGEQQDAVSQALAAASENQTQQLQRYQDIGQMDATYYREGSPAATMRGNELRTNLLDQLTQYLNQVEAERTSGIQSGYMDQLNQANSQLYQQQQVAQNEAARRQEMLWSILQSQMQGSNQAMTPDSYMSSLPSNLQRSVAESFTQLQRSPEAIYGKTRDPRTPDGAYVETTPQWYMAQADQMLQSGQITPEEHQALLYYLQLKFKS